LAASSIAILLILADSNNKKDNIIYMALISFVIFSTFRTKAIVIVAIFWILYIMISKFKIRNKWIFAIIGIPVILFLSYNQINTYFFSSSWSARAVMLQDSIELAKQYFPFGGGFASFGTNMSAQFYSPVYYTFGYNLIPEMAPGTARYLTDGFWQAIIGQFGVIGILSFSLIIYGFFRIILKKKIEDVGEISYCSLLGLNIYLIISSIGEMAYFAPFGILYFIIYAMILNEKESIENKSENKEN